MRSMRPRGTLLEKGRGDLLDPESWLMAIEIDHEVREALLSLPHDYKMVVLFAISRVSHTRRSPTSLRSR